MNRAATILTNTKLPHSLTPLLLGLSLTFCGVDPSDEKDEDAKSSNLDGTEVEASDDRLAFEFTADYQATKVDVLILKENSDRLNSNQNPFATRLFRADDPDVEQAFQEMAVRLYFLEADWQAGFMEAMFASDDDARLNAGELVAGREGDPFFFNALSPNFIDQFKLRSEIQPGNGVTNGIARNNANFLLPYQAIRSLLTRNTDRWSRSRGFLRDSSLLSILYVGYLPQIKESIDASDIAKELDDHRGVGNWVVHTLTPPPEGCAFEQVGGADRHTNMDPFAANSVVSEVYEAYRRPGKMRKLQELTGGLSESICSTSYVDFFRKVVDEGTRNAFFPVQLAAKPKDGTLAVTVSELPVEGWKFQVESLTLLMPTTVQAGTNFVVSFVPDQVVDPTVIEAAAGQVESIAPISGAQLSQQEIDFYGGIRDVLQANGCIGCHGGYGDFEQAWDERAMILDRIGRDPTAAGYMPQGGVPFDSPANQDALVNWLTSG